MSIKQKIVNTADRSFVDNWREAHKWLSVRFAFIAGAILTTVSAYPEEVSKVISYFPDEYRLPLTFIVTTAIPLYLRLRK